MALELARAKLWWELESDERIPGMDGMGSKSVLTGDLPVFKALFSRDDIRKQPIRDFLYFFDYKTPFMRKSC